MSFILIKSAACSGGGKIPLSHHRGGKMCLVTFQRTTTALIPKPL